MVIADNVFALTDYTHVPKINIMKILKTAFTALLICCLNYVFAQHYTPVEQNSSIKFKVSHVMIFRSTVTGTFKGLKGEILFDPKNLGQCSFDVSVQAETINTGLEMRDNDLREEKYFDVDKYKQIVLKSQSITKGPHDNSFFFSGTLTMKGATKTISFPFTAKPVNGGYQFSGGFDLNRLEYNVGPDNSIDKNVEIDIDVFAR
jgi:polyisoprenoid-binding protein YceI